MMKIELDMYQTIAIAVVVLMLGSFLKKKFKVLERFCIPAPVVGGVVFAIFTCICYATGLVEFSFNDILKDYSPIFHFLFDIFYVQAIKKGMCKSTFPFSEVSPLYDL